MIFGGIVKSIIVGAYHLNTSSRFQQSSRKCGTGGGNAADFAANAELTTRNEKQISARTAAHGWSEVQSDDED
jgi:hypothetical protein